MKKKIYTLQFLNYLIAMRVVHYSKNSIIFLPVFFITTTSENYLNLIYTFISLCLISSAGYLFNDVKDLATDKLHSIKKFRPLASNKITSNSCKILAVFLILISLSFSLAADIQIFYLILSYALLSFIYTLLLKKIVFLDLIFLTTFYVLRLISGIMIMDPPITIWSISLGFYFFLTLGSIKRLTDTTSNIEKQSSKIYNNFSIKLLKILIKILIILMPLVFYFYLKQENMVFSSTKMGIVLVTSIYIWNIYLAIKVFNKKIKKDFIAYVMTDFLSLVMIFIIFTFLVANLIANFYF